MEITQDQLFGLSLKELSDLNKLVIDVIKSKRTLVGQQMARKLKVNQEVKIDHKDHADTIFVVHKINRTKAVCYIKGDKMKMFDIGLNMIIAE
jgi:Cft2 family RNA processing exonuclease